MKKFLSMALALIMVFALFAVPSMAAPSTILEELIVDGGFETIGAGVTIAETPTATTIGYKNATAAETISVDGNVVLSLTGPNNTQVNTNTFATVAGVPYKFAVDVYIESPFYSWAPGQIKMGSVNGTGITWSNVSYTLDGTKTALGDTAFSGGTYVNGMGATEKQWLTLEATVTFAQAHTAEKLFVGSAAQQEGTMYIDNLSLTRETQGYNVTVTETNDFGSVVAPTRLGTDGTGTIAITPNDGYFLKEVTLNGEDITEDFTVSLVAGNIVKEGAYTYTLNAANLEEDANIVVTYAPYTMEEVFAYNNADAVISANARLQSSSWAWVTGDRYVITWEAKSATGTTGNITLAGAAANTRLYGPDLYYNWYTNALVLNSGWTSYQTYMDIIADKTDYISFTPSVDANFRNVSVKKISKVAPPAQITVNVTETDDWGTVTAPETVVENGTATITVTPNNGYYLDEVTLNGTDITEDFVGGDLVAGNIVKEGAYTYTLDVTDMEEANIVVTYGQYETLEVFAYNNADAVISANTKLQSDSWAWATGDRYVITWEAKSATDTTGNITLAGSSGSSKLYGPDLYYNWYTNALVLNSEWTSYQTYMDIVAGKTDYISFTPSVDANFRNVSIKKISKEPISVEPTEFTVTGTTNNADYGTVTPATGTVAADGSVTFTVTPKLGYYVAAATLDSENALDKFTNVYAANTITVNNVADDVELAVTFAPVTEKGEEVATLPAVFAPAADTAVTFGKVLAAVGEDDEFGIYLTNAEGEVTTEKGTYGPYFAADAANRNGQYAIEFVGLKPGTYTAKTYVTVNGATSYGAATTFTVVE